MRAWAVLSLRMDWNARSRRELLLKTPEKPLSIWTPDSDGKPLEADEPIHAELPRRQWPSHTDAGGLSLCQWGIAMSRQCDQTANVIVTGFFLCLLGLPHMCNNVVTSWMKRHFIFDHRTEWITIYWFLGPACACILWSDIFPYINAYHVIYYILLRKGTCKILLPPCCKVYGPPRQATGEEDDDDDDEPKVEDWMKALDTVPKHAHRAHFHSS